MERRKFTREFKLEAVRLIKERGVAYAQASRDLGVLRPTSGCNYKRRKICAINYWLPALCVQIRKLYVVTVGLKLCNCHITQRGIQRPWFGVNKDYKHVHQTAPSTADLTSQII